jgi:hypothetical protein
MSGLDPQDGTALNQQDANSGAIAAEQTMSVREVFNQGTPVLFRGREAILEINSVRVEINRGGAAAALIRYVPLANLVVEPIYENGKLSAYNLQIRKDGGKRSKSNQGNAPKSTGQRQTIAGRQRTIYEGPRGGKYIKKDGKFVRI